MDQEFEDEIDRDLLENGPGEPPFIRLAKSEQRVRELSAERAKLIAVIDDHNSGSKQLAKWLEESRLEAMEAKRQAASDRARARMLDADLDAARVELASAKEELLKCVQWQHELRQQRTVVANQNRIQLTYLLECHRKGGITPLFLALEEYVQRLQGETK